MAYTDEEIERCTEILNKYEQGGLGGRHSPHFRCWNCQSDNFYDESGYYICESCDSSNGHSLGYFDMREYDRFHYRRKSRYQRKYHYEKKVKDISKRLELTYDEEYDLFNKLMEIDQDTISKLNKQFNRKRMISIFYLVVTKTRNDLQ